MPGNRRSGDVRKPGKTAALLLVCWMAATATGAAAPRVTGKSMPASTPPMGWNSWDSYGLTINAAEFRQSVDWLDAHLKRYGWRYAVVDEGWYLQHPENAGMKGADQGYTLDASGRYIPAPNRFPRGLKALADYAHARGLKFGIHIIRGIPRKAVEENLPIAGSSFHAADAADTSDTCRWNPDNYGIKANAAGQAYYHSIARLYAAWGVDFLKVDCISSPYRTAEIHMVSTALRSSGRPIVLSLSPGPTPLADAEDVVNEAQMWRISDDMWDVWSKPPGAPDFPQSLTGQFVKLASWVRYAGGGHWPDADMLPIGTLGPRPGWGSPRSTRLTPAEVRTLLTLWCIARSPLILGANLSDMDTDTEALLTDPEVIAVDQRASGQHEVIKRGNDRVWVSRSETGAANVAVFNLGDSERTASYEWSDLGVRAGRHAIRDLWQRRDQPAADRLTVSIPAHGARLFAVAQP